MVLFLVKLDPDRRDARGQASYVATIGRVVDVQGGYRFLPNTSTHKPSRKVWPTANACIPKWTEHCGFLALFERAELDAAQAASKSLANPTGASRT